MYVLEWKCIIDTNATHIENISQHKVMQEEIKYTQQKF